MCKKNVRKYYVFNEKQVFLEGTYLKFWECPKAPFRMTPVIYTNATVFLYIYR